jgi:uncharacterized membrane protein YadS
VCGGANVMAAAIATKKQERKYKTNQKILTLCSRVVYLIKYPLMPKKFKFFEFSTPKCTVTYILTL